MRYNKGTWLYCSIPGPGAEKKQVLKKDFGWEFKEDGSLKICIRSRKKRMFTYRIAASHYCDDGAKGWWVLITNANHAVILEASAGWGFIVSGNCLSIRKSGPTEPLRTKVSCKPVHNDDELCSWVCNSCQSPRKLKISIAWDGTPFLAKGLENGPMLNRKPIVKAVIRPPPHD